MPESEDVELAAGLAFMIISWFMIFLVAIGVFDLTSEQKIALSLFLYALSVLGLALSSHGVVVKVAVKKRKAPLTRTST